METLEARRQLTTYFIDAQLGNDGNDGLAIEQAWQSLDRLSNAALQPGDTVLLRRDSNWDQPLTLSDSGSGDQPIHVHAFGEGQDPIVSRLTIDGSHYVFSDFVVDRRGLSGDAVRVRNAKNVELREMEIRNGVSDGIDAYGADGLLVEGLRIHHFLAGSFVDQKDAHGIVVSDTRGVTIRDTEIHHVSGDSFQADPDRDRQVTTDILIEGCHFWTAPLVEDFGDHWLAGQRPGENAIDTKMVKSDWDSIERMKITVRDVVAHGWVADDYISNRAVFNMKEKIDAVFDGVTVFDSEIGFRLRGGRGNADVMIKNAVMYDLEKAVRAEDDLENLIVLNTTFGNEIDQVLQFAGGSGGIGSWEWKNNALLASALPSVVTDPSNRLATSDDFLDASANKYRLAQGASLIDSGTEDSRVAIDRIGVPRPQGNAIDVGAFEALPVFNQGPAMIDSFILNDGADQRSIVDSLTVQFDSFVEFSSQPEAAFQIVNRQTGDAISTSATIEVVEGATHVRLQFLAGPSVEGRGDLPASLMDGNYQLTVVGTLITSQCVELDGDGDGVAGGDAVFGQVAADRFFRLFGDSDGDRDTDGQDYGRFGLSFLTQGTNSAFDFDGDDDVDGQDYGYFGARFLKTMTF